MKMRKLTRREMLKSLGLAVAGAALAGCTPEVVKETVIVEKPVDKVVKETVIVEKVVTAVPAPEEPEELVFWHNMPSGAWYDCIDAMVTKFNEENPNIIVTHSGFEHQQFTSTLLPTAFAGGAPPDIFRNTGFEWLFQFIRAGDVLDLTEWHQTAGKDRYIPGIESSYDYEGKLWGVPWRVGHTSFVHYNVDLMDQFGLSEDDLKTVGDWMAACETVLAGDGYPIAFGGLGGWLAVHWVSNFIDRIVGADAAIALFTKQAGHWSDAGVVEALEYFKTFYDRGYLGEDTVTEDYSVASQRYHGGEAVMFGTGGWETGSAVSTMTDNPDMHLDFVQFPGVTGKPGKSGDWIFWGEVFSGAKSRQSIPAKIRFLDAMGSKEYQQVCYEIRQDQYAAIGYDEGSSIEMHPLLKKMDDLYGSASALVPIPDVAMSPAAAGVLNEELTGILLDQVSIEEAMAHVDAALAEHDGYA